MRRLLRAIREPQRLRRAILRRLPGVVHVGRRATLRRLSFRGQETIRKSFADGALARAALERELEARRLFAGRPWLVPTRAHGDGWIELPALPAHSRLDRAIVGMAGATRLEIARQLIWALFDIFYSGFAHCDLHCGNGYWWKSRLVLADYEKLTPYPPGARPAFPESYDLTGTGLDPPSDTEPMYWDGQTPSRAEPGVVLGISAAEAVEILKRDVELELAAASSSFASGSARHRTRAGRIYSSFRLPFFEVPAAAAQRDSARRLERLGVGAAELTGRSLLDLGCNVGSMLFESQRLGPASTLGIDLDTSKVELARRVAAFAGLRNAVFEQGDLEELNPAALGRFDVVYCFAVAAHLREPRRLFDLLAAVTGGTLYFEGNESTNPAQAGRDLARAGFRQVDFLGLCDDDVIPENNRRPMFRALA